MRFNGFSKMRASMVRGLIGAALISALAMAPVVGGPILGLHTHSAHAQSHRTPQTCGWYPDAQATASGQKAVLWEWTCTGLFHAQAINQTGATANTCATLFKRNAGDGLNCAVVANGGSVNAGNDSDCNNAYYQASALVAPNIVSTYTQSVYCII